MRLRTGFCALIAVLALLGVSPALADHVLGTKGGTTYVLGKQTITTHGKATVEVRCPKGTHVWGGGFDADMSRLTATGSEPFDGPDGDRMPDDGWRAHLKASAPDQGRVYAICRNGVVSYEHNGRPLGSHDIGSATAGCRPGTHAISGGGSIRGAALRGSFPYDSSADSGPARDDGWRIQALAGGKPGRVGVWAICGTRKVSRSTSRFGLDGHSGVAGGPGCARKTTVVGVGARLSGGIRKARLKAIAPASFASSPVPSDAARGQLENGGNKHRFAAVYAICT